MERGRLPGTGTARRAGMRFATCMLGGVLGLLALAACGEKPQTVSTEPPPAPGESKPPEPEAVGEEVAVIQTNSGTIVLRLYEVDAPKTVAEFKRLAGRNFYNGTTFHRVIADRLIQGGDPLTRDRDPYNDGTGSSGNTLPAEFNRNPFRPGTVGLARGPSPDSGSCQFFICLARNPGWDGQYTAFAEVIEGLDVARKISSSQTNPNSPVPQMRERPIREQLIESVRIERRKLD